MGQDTPNKLFLMAWIILIKNYKIMNKDLIKLILELASESEEKVPDSRKKDNVNKDYMEIGCAYHVETVTKYWYGIFQGYDSLGRLIFDNVSWVADTGRYGHAMKMKVSYGEVECIEGTIALERSVIAMLSKRDIITLVSK